MMKLTTTIVALAVVALAASTVSAQHFDRQRKEAHARQAAAQQQFGAHHGVSHHGVSGHWGGPTTRHRYYHPSAGFGGIQQNIQFYPVNPYGYGFPRYGYGGFPCYGSPFGGSGVYIHREIYLGR